jgi:hypothetical protein
MQLTPSAFLFTYNRMTEEALRGDSIDLSFKSIHEISDVRSRAIIAVSYRQSVMWTIPVEECHTWLVSLEAIRIRSRRAR